MIGLAVGELLHRFGWPPPLPVAGVLRAVYRLRAPLILPCVLTAVARPG